VNPNCDVNTVLCDLSSFESVKNAINSVKSLTESIDLLILNAGLWNFEFIESKDNIEETLHVNLLSQIFMFNELEALIPRNDESKVIFTSSGLHQGEIQFEDLEFRKNFSGFKAYRQSKLGLLLLTRWLAKKANIPVFHFTVFIPVWLTHILEEALGGYREVSLNCLGKQKKKVHKLTST